MPWDKSMRNRVLFKLKFMRANQPPDDNLLRKLDPSIFDHKDLQTIVQVLNISKWRKEEKHINYLKRALLKFEFFQKKEKELTNDAFSKLFLNLSFDSKSKHEAVVRYGEIGTKFYFLLKGTVYVLLPTEKYDENGDLLPSYAHAEHNFRYPNEELAEKYSKFYISHFLSCGDTFGELALQQKVPRTATILCENKCEFITLTHDVYMNILGDHQLQLIDLKMKFLRTSPIFSKWSNVSLNELLYSGESKEFSKGAVILDEKDFGKSLYVICAGEVEISKNYKIDLELYKYMLNTNSLDLKKYYKIINSDSKLPENELGLLLKQYMDNKLTALKPKKSASKDIFNAKIIIGKLSRGQTIGEEFLLDDARSKTLATVSSSTATIFVFPINKTKRLMKDSNELSNSIVKRDKWREDRAIELINALCMKRIESKLAVNIEATKSTQTIELEKLKNQIFPAIPTHFFDKQYEALMKKKSLIKSVEHENNENNNILASENIEMESALSKPFRKQNGSKFVVPLEKSNRKLLSSKKNSWKQDLSILSHNSSTKLPQLSTYIINNQKNQGDYNFTKQQHEREKIFCCLNLHTVIKDQIKTSASNKSSPTILINSKIGSLVDNLVGKGNSISTEPDGTKIQRFKRCITDFAESNEKLSSKANKQYLDSITIDKKIKSMNSGGKSSYKLKPIIEEKINSQMNCNYISLSQFTLGAQNQKMMKTL